MTQDKAFKASLILLVPVIASLAFSVFCAFLFFVSDVGLPAVTPLSEAGFGPVLNAMIFVIAASIGASVVYLILKHKKRWMIRFMIGFAVTVVTFLLSDLYLWMLFSLLNAGSVDMLAFVNAVLVTIVVDVELFVLDNRGYQVIILMLGGALGAFLGMTIPTFSAVLVLLFLAVYDIVAVFRGPVGKIASEGLEQLRGLSFSFRDIQMGLGDLTFYSMLVGHAFVFFGAWACLGGAVGILLGSYSSFKMLERRDMLPGLPFSIVLGLLGVFITVMI